MSRSMTKPTKWPVHPAKTSAWADTQSDQSSLSAWRNLGSLATHWAHSNLWSDWASESSLDALVILLVLSCGDSNTSNSVVTAKPIGYKRSEKIERWLVLMQGILKNSCFLGTQCVTYPTSGSLLCVQLAGKYMTTNRHLTPSNEPLHDKTTKLHVCQVKTDRPYWWSTQSDQRLRCRMDL